MNNILASLCDEKIREFLKKHEKTLEFLKKMLPSQISEKEKEISEYGFQLNSRTCVKSGDIIYRPLSKFETDLSMDMNHYGIVFGQMRNGECLVLENSSKVNVNFKSLLEFADTHSVENIEVERKNKGTSFNLILNRAKEIEHDRYSLTHFNCRHFVNYCVHGEKISEQVETVKSVASPILHILSVYFRGTSIMYANKRDRDVIINIAKKIELITANIDELK